MGREQTLIDGISGLMADFLQLIDVNAGGLRLRKGQGILHPAFWGKFYFCAFFAYRWSFCCLHPEGLRHTN